MSPGGVNAVILGVQGAMHTLLFPKTKKAIRRQWEKGAPLAGLR